MNEFQALNNLYELAKLLKSPTTEISFQIPLSLRQIILEYCHYFMEFRLVIFQTPYRVSNVYGIPILTLVNPEDEHSNTNTKEKSHDYPGDATRSTFEFRVSMEDVTQAKDNENIEMCLGRADQGIQLGEMPSNYDSRRLKVSYRLIDFPFDSKASQCITPFYTLYSVIWNAPRRKHGSRFLSEDVFGWQTYQDVRDTQNEIELELDHTEDESCDGWSCVTDLLGIRVPLCKSRFLDATLLEFARPLPKSL